MSTRRRVLLSPTPEGDEEESEPKQPSWTPPPPPRTRRRYSPVPDAVSEQWAHHVQLIVHEVLEDKQRERDRLLFRLAGYLGLCVMLALAVMLLVRTAGTLMT